MHSSAAGEPGLASGRCLGVKMLAMSRCWSLATGRQQDGIGAAWVAAGFGLRAFVKTPCPRTCADLHLQFDRVVLDVILYAFRVARELAPMDLFSNADLHGRPGEVATLGYRSRSAFQYLDGKLRHQS